MTKNIGPFSILHLKNLNGGAPFTERLAATRGAAPMCTRFKLSRSPEVSGQFGYLGKSCQKQLMYKQRKLARKHGLEFKIKLGAELSEGLEMLVDLHHKRSISKGRKSLLVGANLEFLRSIVRLLAEKFEIVELQASGRPIASTLVLIDRSCCYGIQ